jgi:hypothetical protein
MSDFEWLSGEAAVFDPEPEGDGDCIMIDGEFLDYVRVKCMVELQFICERAAATPN